MWKEKFRKENDRPMGPIANLNKSFLTLNKSKPKND